MPNRAAVVIGINYRDPSPPGDPPAPPSGARPTPLRYAEDDAKAVAALLEAEGFQVTTLIGEAATEDAITGTIRQQSRAISGPDSLLVVYFAGHGFMDPDDDRLAYLLPYNVAPDDLVSTAIPLENLDQRYILPNRSALILLVAHHYDCDG